MRGTFGLLYFFLFLSCVITSFFILFHITRYALNQRVASLAAIIFIIVSGILLLTNALLFFNLPLETLLPPTAFSTFR